MSSPLFSSLWYRVADLKPKIREQAKFHRLQHRGKIWYVIQDHSSGQHHRFNDMAYQLISMMDGINTLQQIWDLLNERYDDDAPTQDETIQILGQLYAVDTIQCEIDPDTAELFDRYQQHKNSTWKSTFLNPLSLKIPLIDPDKFLIRFLPFAKLIFTKSAFLIWLLTIFSAFVLAISHWSELTENIHDQILSADNILLLVFIYPIIKLLHELGHAFAVKVWGGTVHEMGLILLALIPNPYVNTTSAWSFTEKHKRITVSAAGMMVELFLASCALFLWLTIEPGLIRAAAFNVMFIASITTLIFNANPLLRFDGYYILSDLIEIPNLASRSNKYLIYLIQHHLFGLSHIRSQTTDKTEKAWFVMYGIAAFFYRLFILTVITLFVAGKFFFIGVLLALWAITTQIAIPLLKSISFLFTNSALHHRRLRAVSVSSIILFSCMITIFFLPVPNNTVAQGVVWLPENSELRSKTNGFIKQILVENGAQVKIDSPLILLYDPLLIAEEAVQKSILQELRLKQAAERIENYALAEITENDIGNVEAKLARIEEQKQSLMIYSQSDGVFSMANDYDLTDRYMGKGKLIGYIIKPSLMTARVVVKQKDIGLVRKNTDHVEIKLAGDLTHTIPASIRREVPAASNKLPSRALSILGGGSISTNPTDQEGLESLEKVFQFDINLLEASDHNHIGGRVYAKFNHGKQPLAQRWYRSLRQLFLKQFDV